MPVTYTNRKGVTYTLYRKIGADGKPHYHFGRKGDGEPVAELPPGFRISESPNGIVSLARDRPMLIQPEEIAAVEAAIARSPDAGNYRVAIKDKRIEIYAKVGPDAVAVYDTMVSAGLLPPGKDDLMRQFDDLHAQFTPVLRITLRDPARRWFSAEERISYQGTDY